MNLSERQFLTCIISVFFAAIIINLLLSIENVNNNISSFIVYISSSISITLLLRDRLRQLHVNMYWSILGIMPGIGILFGLLIYLYPTALPKEEGRGD